MYPSGTGIELAMLEVHIKYMVALKDLLQEVCERNLEGINRSTFRRATSKDMSYLVCY